MLRQAFWSRGSAKPQSWEYCRWNSGIAYLGLTAPQPEQRWVGLTVVVVGT